MPSSETKIDPRQPRLLEKKTNTRLALARLRRDVDQLDALNHVPVDQQHGDVARLVRHLVSERHAATTAQHFGEAFCYLACLLVLG